MYIGVFDRPIRKDKDGNDVYTAELERASSKIMTAPGEQIFTLRYTIDDYAYYFYEKQLEEGGDLLEVEHEGEWIPLSEYLRLMKNKMTDRRKRLPNDEDVV